MFGDIGVFYAFLSKKGATMNKDYDSLFCFVDDFCKGFENWYKKTLITRVLESVIKHVK